MMKKYGIFDIKKNCVVKTYKHCRMKNISLSSGQIQFELNGDNGIHGTDELAYRYNSETEKVEYNHDYVPFNPSDKYCKIYRYVEDKHKYNLKKAPMGLNYKNGLTTKLHSKRYFTQGELQKVEWYANPDLTDLVLIVDIQYKRDSLGFASERITTRTWINEDESEASPKKITKKVYSNDTLSQIEEGIKRRGNIVKGLQMPVLGSMLATIPTNEGESEPERQGRVLLMGRRFLATYKKEFTLFIEDSNKEIKEQLKLANDYWLNNVIDANGTTIRSMLLKELSIDEPV